MDNKQKLDEINKLANSLGFELDEYVQNRLLNEWDGIKAELSTINETKFKNIELTNFVNDPITENDLFDEEVIDYDPKQVFSNCKTFNGKYVVIKDEK